MGAPPIAQLSPEDQARRRATWRRHADKYRAQKQDRARAGHRRCPRRFGTHGVCRGFLQVDVLPGGRITVTCPRCERTARGICMDCPARVEGQAGKARRCARCKQVARRRQEADSRARHREARCAREKRRYRTNDEFRRRRNEANKEWRRQNPLKVALQKRRARLSGRQGWASREKYLAYHAAYRARHRAECRIRAREERQAKATLPTCHDCGAAVVYGRLGRPPKRCEGCQQNHSLTRRAA